MSWLDELQVASPCTESWEDMQGDARSRHCARCDHAVHDLSALTRAEAEELLADSLAGASICVRFRRRADGTVVSADCPERLQRGRRSAWWRAAAALLTLGGAGLAQGCDPAPEVMGKMECAPPPPLAPAQPAVAPIETRVSSGKLLPRAGALPQQG